MKGGVPILHGGVGLAGNVAIGFLHLLQGVDTLFSVGLVSICGGGSE